MLTTLQYKILKAISPGEPDTCSGAAYAGKSKLAILLGEDFLKKIKGKAVIDFGCGEGAEAVEMAQNGAMRVFGPLGTTPSAGTSFLCFRGLIWSSVKERSFAGAPISRQTERRSLAKSRADSIK